MHPQLKHKAIKVTLLSLKRILGLTQRDLATVLCTTPVTISRWNCGEALPTGGLARKLSLLFGIDDALLAKIRRAESWDVHGLARLSGLLSVVDVLSQDTECSIRDLLADPVSSAVIQPLIA